MKSRRRSLIGGIGLLLALSALPALCGVATSQGFTNPVDWATLTSIRGGVSLPNGLDLDIGIDIQTQVNGVLALHTVLSTAAPKADQLRIYSGGTPPSNAGLAAVNLSTASPPSLVLNRSSATTQVQPVAAPANSVVLVANAPVNLWPMYPSEPRVNLAPGQVATTPQGAIQLQQANGENAVSLSSNGLLITHLLGQSTGVVVANQLNDQVIQSTTVVDVAIHGSWPMTANAMFSVGDIAVNAVRRP